ncbi:MAG: Uma2 family endonuclease [Gemmataceae bacterium]|nr:Uma2 family endonuclease [Gemmataceae bacterium]
MASVRTKSHNQRVVLDGVDWRTYERLLRAFGERRSVRLTYDRGTLEIMILSYEHEGYGYLLGQFVDILAYELEIAMAPGRSTTLRRRKGQRGLESDNCYWIAHEAQIRGKKRIDLRIDPPPDLAMEVDVTHSSMDRMAVYAGLGVPEIWRHDGQVLTFHLLGKDGYGPDTPSANFPGLKAADVMPFLALLGQMQQTALVLQFRDWIRQQIAAGVLSRPTP